MTSSIKGICNKYKFDIKEYELLEKINQGGFAIIYLVQNKTTGEQFAAKIIYFN